MKNFSRAWPTFLLVFLFSCNNEVADVVTTKTLDFSYMDTTIAPADDFYSYACGQWIKDNPVPPSETRWSSFNVLQNSNVEILRGILEKSMVIASGQELTAQLTGDYFYTIMDSAKRDADGIAPLAEDLLLIDALKDMKGLAALLARHHKLGVPSAFRFSVTPDDRLSTENIAEFSQTRFGLPDREYYTDQDEKAVETREKYLLHVQKMMGFLNEKWSTPEIASKIMAFEADLASASMNKTERRDQEAQYNKMSWTEFTATCSKMDWAAYSEALALPQIDTLLVRQPAFFKKLNTLITPAKLDTWKLYLRWTLINSTAATLSSEIEAQDFAFYQATLRGAKAMKPRWKRGLAAMDWSAVGQPLGKVFVDNAFSPEAKKKVNEMVDNITAVFGERIKSLEWMGEETKVQAQVKLAAFNRKLAYPDNWEDFSKLKIGRESYFANRVAGSQYEFAKMIDKLGKPVDRTEWFMAAHIVNAYYEPLYNEIVFPAGIMQPPFFDPEMEDAVNYATMGAVIGHELTHGFDDQGSQFDANGNLRNWWTSDDSSKFAGRTQKLVDHYNSFEAMPELFVNGQMTLGENIADLGGLTIAYYAYQKSLEGKEKEIINNLTPEQRFFVAFGQIWKNSITDEAMRERIKTDYHSPGKYRVNGTLANMPEFFAAFNIPEGAAMRQPEDKIAKIW